jgi:hypothetical protein
LKYTTFGRSCYALTTMVLGVSHRGIVKRDM